MGILAEAEKEVVPLLDSPAAVCVEDSINFRKLASPRGNLIQNEEVCNSGEEQMYSCDGAGPSSELEKLKLKNTRYFIIKSLNHQNIQLSVKKGIWATQIMNEPILEEAFMNSGKVILIFSVNMSGFFQGYAQMMSPVSWRRDDIWSQGSGKTKPWGRSFKVRWLCLHELPFQSTLHLKNSWNDDKPVKISRDCQELPWDIGEALCELLDRGNNVVSQKRNELSGDDLPRRRLCVEPFEPRRADDFNSYQECMSPMYYPSFSYQHRAEASGFQLPFQRSSFVDKSSLVSGISNVEQSKPYPTNWIRPSSINNTSRSGSCGLSADCSTFTEDEILAMSYEEYVEAHNRGLRKFHRSAGVPSASFQKSSSSKERSDDSQSASSSKKRTYHQLQE